MRYTADLRSIAFVLAYFALVAGAYALELSGQLPWYGLLILVPVISLLSFFCAVITHNTVHVPVFRSRFLNRVFQVALTLCYGHPVSAYVPGHNLSHHLHTQTPKDLMRTNKLQFRWNLLNQALFSFVVGPTIFSANIRYVKKMRKAKPAWYRQFLIELAFYLLFLVGTLALSWKLFLLLIVIPHQYAAWGIMGINFVQHDGCDPDHPYNHSRNFTGALVNWFTFNNGYHGMHHIKAGLHWSLLPQAHAEKVAPHIHPELDQSSLLAYLIKAYLWPGRRVRFDGTPVVVTPRVPDEEWIPEPRDVPDDTSLGAIT